MEPECKSWTDYKFVGMDAAQITEFSKDGYWVNEVCHSSIGVMFLLGKRVCEGGIAVRFVMLRMGFPKVTSLLKFRDIMLRVGMVPFAVL